MARFVQKAKFVDFPSIVVIGIAVARTAYRAACCRLGAAELVFDADDVILAEVGAGLHFDQLEQDLAGVGEAMDAAERQVDRLVFG